MQLRSGKIVDNTQSARSRNSNGSHEKNRPGSTQQQRMSNMESSLLSYQHEPPKRNKTTAATPVEASGSDPNQWRTPANPRTLHQSTEQLQLYTPTPRTPGTQRLNFESDDEELPQPVYDYNFGAETKPLLRRTPYNQRGFARRNGKEAQDGQTYPTSWQEMPLYQKRTVPPRMRLPATRTESLPTSEQDDDYLPSLMDVRVFSNPNLLGLDAARRFSQPNESKVRRSWPGGDEDNEDAHNFWPCTPSIPETPAARKSASEGALFRAQSAGRGRGTKRWPGRQSAGLLRGMCQSPLSVIAKQIGRPSWGPFYKDGPEHRNLMEQLGTGDRKQQPDSWTPSIPVHQSEALCDLAPKPDGPGQLDKVTIEGKRHSLTVTGRFDKVMLDDTLVWPQTK